jgi:hypothetical protein
MAPAKGSIESVATRTADAERILRTVGQENAETIFMVVVCAESILEGTPDEMQAKYQS